MKLRYLMAASAIAACVGLASPAMANDNNKHNDNSTVSGTSGSSAAASGLGIATSTDNGNNRDNTANNNGNNRDNESNGNGNTLTTGDINLGGFQANGDDRGNSDSSGSGNTTFGNNAVVADQELSGVIVGHDMKDVVDNVDGYDSGDQNVQGNSFAAYAGILNQAWNTGIAANTQAGTNIAASAQVNFANSSNSGDQANGKGSDSAN